MPHLAGRAMLAAADVMAQGGRRDDAVMLPGKAVTDYPDTKCLKK